MNNFESVKKRLSDEHEEHKKGQINDARQRAKGLREAQPGDRDLISVHPEWGQARDAEKKREASKHDRGR